MIRVAIAVLDEQWDSHQICRDKNDKPMTNAEWYEYEMWEDRQPEVTIDYKQEALLNDEGKPYIHSWNEIAYKPSWEDWQKEGSDHTQRILEVGSMFNMLYKQYRFTRKITKGCWIVSYETLEELKQNIKEAIHCHFEVNAPKIVRLHQIKEEVFAA